MDSTKAKRRKPSLPQELRQALVEHVRSIAREHRAAFKADPELKVRVLRLTRALLPPRPRRRGRPRNQETTRAIMLYNRFRRQCPQEKPHEIWDHVCLALYSGYADLPEVERHDIRDALRGRVKSRVRSRQLARKSR